MATAAEPPVEEAPEPSPDVGPPFTCERGDASTVERWDVPSRTYRRYESGDLAEERTFTAAENTWADRMTADGIRRLNREELLRRARTALISNTAYLNKAQAGAATNADHLAQVPALTRQMQSMIRLIVGSDLLDQS